MSETANESSPHIIATCIFGIVSALIVATMIFEFIQEKVLHEANTHMKPFISAVFGELTILGFLSLLVFVISKTGLISQISEEVFHDEENLEELIEKVHYLLFFIMVLFVTEAIFLLKAANNTVSVWRKFNKDSQNTSALQLWKQKYLYETTPNNILCCFTPFINDSPDRFFAFYSMRQEFIKARQSTPPFQSNEEAKLSETFDYAEYLALELGHLLSHLIHLPPAVWASLWVGIGVFYGIFVFVSDNLVQLAFIWLLFGILNLFLAILLESKCCDILCHLMNPSDFPTHSKRLRNIISFILEARQYKPVSDNSNPENTSSSFSKFELQPLQKKEVLPAWTSLKPVSSNWIVQMHEGKRHVPNRHQFLFWFDHHGPHFNSFLLRLHLLFSSVYVSLVLAVFTPVIATEYGVHYGALYLAVSMISIVWENVYIIEDLVSNLSHIQCSGLMKNQDHVDEVIRKQKSKRAVRAVMLMSCLTKSNGQILRSAEEGKPRVEVDESELSEIKAVFDMYDENGSGEIDSTELGSVLTSLGFNLSDVDKQKMFVTLDWNGDGSVSRKEFIDWYIHSSKGTNVSMNEMARDLFALFDKDGSGSLGISELIDGLSGLKHGLSYNEVVELAKELDENGDGRISLAEFEAIVAQD